MRDELADVIDAPDPCEVWRRRIARRAGGRLPVSTLAHALTARAAAVVMTTRHTRDAYGRPSWPARLFTFYRNWGACLSAREATWFAFRSLAFDLTARHRLTREPIELDVSPVRRCQALAQGIDAPTSDLLSRELARANRETCSR